MKYVKAAGMGLYSGVAWLLVVGYWSLGVLALGMVLWKALT